MGLPLLSLIFLSLGFIFFPLLVQSQQSTLGVPGFAPPPSHRPPPPASHRSPTPVPTSSPFLLPPPPSSRSPAPKNNHPRGPSSSNKARTPQQSDSTRHSHESKVPPSKDSKQRQHSNLGKKVGFFFVGAAAILQVCMVTFLLVRRRQLMKFYDRF